MPAGYFAPSGGRLRGLSWGDAGWLFRSNVTSTPQTFLVRSPTAYTPLGAAVKPPIYNSVKIRPYIRLLPDTKITKIGTGCTD